MEEAEQCVAGSVQVDTVLDVEMAELVALELGHNPRVLPGHGTLVFRQ
jgi:hypothetical protein